MDKWLKASIALAVVPLVAATVIFVFFLATRWLVFPLLGVFTVYAGLVLVAIGVLCLIIYYVVSRRRRAMPYPCREPMAERVWSTMTSRVPCMRSSFFAVIFPPVVAPQKDIISHVAAPQEWR